MSDDRPAIAALLGALDKYGIGREEVSPLNQIKLELLHPDRCAACGFSEEQTGELLTVKIHRSCWSHVLHGGEVESTGAVGPHRVLDEGCESSGAEVHEEVDKEAGAA